MDFDAWAPLADRFADGAYATVKGRVRTRVLHRQLSRHLPRPPASVLDVGGGAGHQSIPLAHAGYDVTILDPSAAMLAKARRRLADEPAAVRDRVRLIQACGEDAVAATRGRRFAAVLCHGVVMYLDDPAPLLAAVARCARPGGVVSVMALNAETLAVRPALAGDWDAALAAFDADRELGVLGVGTRADTVAGLSESLRDNGVDPLDWYGVWLFCDWRDFDDDTDVAKLTEVEWEAGRRDPYRRLSRVFHLVGTRRAD